MDVDWEPSDEECWNDYKPPPPPPHLQQQQNDFLLSDDAMDEDVTQLIPPSSSPPYHKPSFPIKAAPDPDSYLYDFMSDDEADLEFEESLLDAGPIEDEDRFVELPPSSGEQEQQVDNEMYFVDSYAATADDSMIDYSHADALRPPTPPFRSSSAPPIPQERHDETTAMFRESVSADFHTVEMAQKRARERHEKELADAEASMLALLTEADRQWAEATLEGGKIMAEGMMDARHRYVTSKFFGGTPIGLDNNYDIIVDKSFSLKGWQDASAILPIDRLRPENARKFDRVSCLFYLVPVTRAEFEHLLPVEIPLNAQTCQDYSSVMGGYATRKTLETGAGIIIKYLEWAEANNIEPIDRFPCNVQVIAMWLASLKGLSVKWISNHLTHIKNWHGMHGLSFDLPKSQWRMIRQGLANYAPTPKPEKPPVLLSDIELLHRVLILENGSNWAVAYYTEILVGFFGVVRAGHLHLESQKAFDPDWNVQRKHVFFAGDVDGPENGAEIRLPFEKSAGRKGGIISLFRFIDEDRYDPVFWLRTFCSAPLRYSPTDSYALLRTDEMLRRGDGIAANEPLLSYWSKDKHGNKMVVRATRRGLTRALDFATETSNRPPLRGHSLRVGGATFYLGEGVNPHVVKMLGRWKGDKSFHLYWREFRAICSIHLNGGFEDERPLTNPAKNPIARAKAKKDTKKKPKRKKQKVLDINFIPVSDSEDSGPDSDFDID